MLFIIKTDKANKQPDGRTDGQVVSQVEDCFNEIYEFSFSCCGSLFNLFRRFDIYLHFSGKNFLFSVVLFVVFFVLKFFVSQLLPIGGKLTQRLVAISERGCCTLFFFLFIFCVLQRQQSIDQAIKRSNERAKAAPAMSKSFEPIDGQ